LETILIFSSCNFIYYCTNTPFICHLLLCIVFFMIKNAPLKNIFSPAYKHWQFQK
jgi:hypothetical protein